MATLKEFEEALRQHGMSNALAILEQLKKRDREQRSVTPARRIVGRKMTTELARTVLEMHATTGMTQQEIAFKLGVNQGRVNEVIKRGKWLNGDPSAPEARSRDKAIERLNQRAKARRGTVPGAQPVVQGAESATQVANLLQRKHAEAPGTAPARTAELPLGRARTIVPKSAERGTAKQAARRISDEATHIVSAQLAFLDL